ncbi:DUF2892 domain-containing protein [Aquibacillus koreensis]|uniref:DUF2892 domain-containing protein n=1 Tax=Aquibacillus koreensis TaxID=279446 RepID=A0A9X3WJX3_9BACI|nr:DUF2892 domain-containing protein [Aquibacillus koreensis]MCT2536806.1 DUF2892 domain-containing protein [Aquibacillus koreensis]MDC3421437.1 DUF2892 domain-containing protein [Aquibacillus koreensis]
MKQNIGIVNALIRITCGFTLLTYATARMVQRPWRQSSLLIAMMAAMKIGEGIVRYCPVTDVISRSMTADENNHTQNQSEPVEPINPS